MLSKADDPSTHETGDPTMATAETARRIVGLAKEEEITFKAAAIAFYALVSIIPLLIISLAVLSLLGAEDTLISVLQSNLSGSANEVLDTILSETQGHGVAGGIGALFTLWSAIKIFRGLSVAFVDIYQADPDISLLDQVKRSLVVFAFVLLAVVILSATGLLLTFVPFQIPYPTLVWNALAVVMLVIGLLPLYYVLPPGEMTVGDALPGAIIAGIGWVLLQYGFSYYAQNAGSYAAYGFLGAILLFVTLLYIAAIILLIGAVVNVVLDRERTTGDRGVTRGDESVQ